MRLKPLFIASGPRRLLDICTIAPERVSLVNIRLSISPAPMTPMPISGFIFPPSLAAFSLVIAHGVHREWAMPAAWVQVRETETGVMKVFHQNSDRSG